MRGGLVGLQTVSISWVSRVSLVRNVFLTPVCVCVCVLRAVLNYYYYYYY